MAGRLSGMVTIVTGATMGTGLGTAKAFVKADISIREQMESVIGRPVKNCGGAPVFLGTSDERYLTGTGLPDPNPDRLGNSRMYLQLNGKRAFSGEDSVNHF